MKTLATIFLPLVIGLGAGATAVAGTPSLPPKGVDFTGVWIAMTSKEAPPAYVNTKFPSPPPFTPEGEKMSKYWADPAHNLGAQCIPGGGPTGVINGSYYFPVEIIQKGTQVTVIPEALLSVRRIFTDGRGHPPDLEKTWMGDSIGHWEGDTLVVDTIGTHAGPLNGSGATVLVLASDKEPRLPYSESLHVTERIHMLDHGKYLEDEITFDDPVMYTHPFKQNRFLRRAPELQILEYVCGENNLDAAQSTPPGAYPPPETAAPAAAK